jgi:hypothetical protein
MQRYTFTVNSDTTFPNRKVDLPRFEQEIRASAIVTALDGSPVVELGNCFVDFRATLSTGDEAILEGLVHAHSGEPLPVDALVSIRGITASEGKLPTSSAKAIAPKLTFISPNWCDKTTWHQNAAAVVDEAATDSGDHLTYTLAHQNVIDTHHGKITFEDALNKRVVVKVNGTAKTEQDPHVGSGGDYTINYATGAITFLSAQQPADAVVVSYHYAQKATFTLSPATGKRLLINTVEIQFSEDVLMNDTFIFQAYGLVDVFAPQLMPGIPSGTKIPIGDPLVYKTFNDLLNDCNGAYPGYPAFGGNNWRALKKQAFIFVWDYTVGATALESAYGMEIRLDLEHDAPCGGTFGTATFYCTSEDS